MSGASSMVFSKRRSKSQHDRLFLVEMFFAVAFFVVVARIFHLQVMKGATYSLLATGQHDLQRILVPERGKILVRDRADQSLHPLATNRDAWQLYVEPRNLKDVGVTARTLVPYSKKTEEELVTAWTKDPNDPYEPVVKGLDAHQSDEISSKELPGVGLVKGWQRYYPEKNTGGHIIGFVRMDDEGAGEGAYGLEGSLDDILSGRSGYVSAQKDADGRRLMLDGGKIRQAVNGSDIVLTIDRTIQYEVCRKLKKAVETYQAQGGTVIVLNPNTGAIMAMCSMPDFDPEDYRNAEDISVFNNPAVFSAYEPGSVFKAITMAIGVEKGKVTPDTTYTDPGVEKIDDFEIKNSDEQSHGLQTMRQVLEKSLNTGTIFVERLLGRESFLKGVEDFGFGEKTGIEVTPEAAGNISSLSKKAEVYGATASFGQGITTTPLQLVSAFSVIANGGRLLRPHIVDEIIHPDGTREKTEIQEVSRPISERTASLVRGMLVSVVERGHGASASVPGYFLAGKTGTAQVADSRGQGYLEGAIVSTFVGFAPADDPAFTMIVKMDRPKVGKWAEVNASPLFKEIASFLLNYLEIPLERDVNAPKEVDAVPDIPPEAAAGAPDVVSIDTQSGIIPQNEVQTTSTSSVIDTKASQ